MSCSCHSLSASAVRVELLPSQCPKVRHMFIGYAKLDGFRFEEGQMSGSTSRLKALSLGFGFN